MTVAKVEHLRSLPDILCNFSVKHIARAAGAHPKTAARWRRGEAAPSGDAILRIMATDSELLVALLHAAGRADFASNIAAQQHLILALAALEEK